MLRGRKKKKPGAPDKNVEKKRGQKPPELEFSEEDLLGINVEDRPSLLFLGAFSEQNIEQVLRKYGVWRELERRGFGNLKLTMDTRDPYRQRLAIHSVIEGLHASLLLAEIVVKRDWLTLTPDFEYAYRAQPLEVLTIEWLTLQDPRLGFTTRKPRLPGQNYPGLGLSKVVLKVILMACKQLNLNGIVNIPEYYHNAQIYSPVASFIDPQCEGKRLAINRDLLKKYHLAKVSWGIDLGCVKENENPFEWFTCQQVIPVKKALREYFRHPEYKKRVKATFEQFHYTLDEKCWEEKLKKFSPADGLT
ncbi:MAG: hypothetical protein D6748_09170 [Calditrichaeota bacterium]|nr:MAG: hypothetical protein D6748_09170 [Calditrichota bacterium]